MSDKLKVCHFAPFTPGRQGMYETVKELIVAQNKQGIESALHDPSRAQGGETDGGITTVDEKWADDADIHVISSILPDKYWQAGIPTVFLAHGMPEAVLMHEMAYDGVHGFCLEEKGHKMALGGDPTKPIAVGSNYEFRKEFPFSTYIAYIQRLKSYAGTVTFWPRHLDVWKPFNKGHLCEYVPGGVDLDRYTPEGKSERLQGDYVGVYADMFRFVKHPLFVYLGFAEAAEKRPGATLYGFGCKEGQVQLWSNMFQQAGWGKFAPRFGNLRKNIEEIYRGNDFLISPVPDSSRVAKEALACGMPVISKCADVSKYVITDDIHQTSDTICKLIDDIKDDYNGVRKKCRKFAEKNYDINNTAKGMVKIYNRVAGG